MTGRLRFGKSKMEMSLIDFKDGFLVVNSQGDALAQVEINPLLNPSTRKEIKENLLNIFQAEPPIPF
jgi:hypothetical protein